MTTSTTRRTTPYRRKREGKTNYKQRLALLKSRKVRLVIRRTNKHIIMQLVSYHPDGDKVLVGVSSKALEKNGWKHSGKNTPAAYLTGMLLGQAAKKAGVAEAILDLGLQTPIKGSKLYAALKGAVDAGLNIPASAEVYPNEERIKGAHLKNDAAAKDFEKVKAALAK